MRVVLLYLESGRAQVANNLSAERSVDEPGVRLPSDGVPAGSTWIYFKPCDAGGAPDNVVRAVTENARTLKFTGGSGSEND